MGHGGSGKSTLCFSMNGLIPRTIRGELKGSVTLAGRDVTDMTVPEIAREIGLVFQQFEAQLFATSVAHEIAFGPENLALPRPELVSRVERYLQLLRLEGLRRREPASLSGGEKQRLAVAAALSLEPGILVMDEPTSDLDPRSKEEVISVSRSVGASQRTLIVVEHDGEAVAGADRLVLMNEGRIAADGPVAEVFADHELARRCGVHPPQLAELCQRLGVGGFPRSVDDAMAALAGRRPRRQVPSPPEPAGATALIEARGISHAYARGGRAAIDGVSLSVAEGEFIALIGQNGSGKTTLVKALSGLVRPDEGVVSIGGRPITSMRGAELAGHIAYVFQDPDHQLFATTARKEVMFGPSNFRLPHEEAERRADEALAVVGLADLAEQDPFTLTKGKRQALAVASMLAMRPRILVLDEPTTGLDHREQRTMMDLLVRLNQAGQTIIIVTHSMPIVAEYARRVIVMKGGHLVLDGPPRDVFRHEDVLAEAGIEPPPVVQLSNRLGAGALSVADMVLALTD